MQFTSIGPVFCTYVSYYKFPCSAVSNVFDWFSTVQTGACACQAQTIKWLGYRHRQVRVLLFEQITTKRERERERREKVRERERQWETERDRQTDRFFKIWKQLHKRVTMESLGTFSVGLVFPNFVPIRERSLRRMLL